LLSLRGEPARGSHGTGASESWLSRADVAWVALIGGPGEDARTCPSVEDRDVQAEQKGESFPVVMR